jgi:glycine amidinotransferase
MSLDNKSPVCSFNEWDPLEEVIVGSVLGAARMGFEPSINAYYGKNDEIRNFSGAPHLETEIFEAEDQLNNLATLLSKMGIVVRRPDAYDFFEEVVTPDFSIKSQNCSACPRDVLLIVGTKIIEASMAQRARFFEYRVYRNLIKEYFKKGANWLVAPKPTMSDKLYVNNFCVDTEPFDADLHNALTDYEPCFDAASFVRFGKDIWYQPDLVTNDFGAQWLRKQLGSEYRIHRVKFYDKHPPQHIDTTLVPLCSGLALINPERPCADGTFDLFKNNGWELVPSPPSVQSVEFYSPEVSNWISMNVLSIDEKTVVAEEKEDSLVKLLEKLGFKVITCPFDKVYKFGGGVHCCTADIRRRGELKSYFSSFD